MFKASTDTLSALAEATSERTTVAFFNSAEMRDTPEAVAFRRAYACKLMAAAGLALSPPDTFSGTSPPPVSTRDAPAAGESTLSTPRWHHRRRRVCRLRRSHRLARRYCGHLRRWRAPLMVRRRRLRSRRRLRLCPHRRPRPPALVHLGVRRRRLRSRRRLPLCSHRRPRPPALVQQAVAGGRCQQSRPWQRRLLPLGPRHSTMRTMAFMWCLFFLCATMARTVRRTG